MQIDLSILKIPKDSKVAVGIIPTEYKSVFDAWTKNEFVPLATASVVDGLIAFVHEPNDVLEVARELKGKMSEDPLLWVMYPKKSSKKNTGLISRDLGWESFASLDIEPVSQRSWDIDYSALRFRRIQNIKNITRNPQMAISQTTKKRTSYQK